jgi:hypothetical protein
VLRLGSAILASVLLGVPRALDARAFGATRSAYVQVAPGSPELEAFAAEFARALGDAGFAAAAGPRGTTLVVEIHGIWRSAGESGPGSSDAVSFTVHDRRGTRLLVLHFQENARSTAARALLRSLGEPRGRTPLD